MIDKGGHWSWSWGIIVTWSEVTFLLPEVHLEMRLQQRLHPFTVPPFYFTSACSCLFASIVFQHTCSTDMNKAGALLHVPSRAWPLWPLPTVDKTMVPLKHENESHYVLSCSWYHPSHAYVLVLLTAQDKSSLSLYQRPLKWKLYELLSLLTITVRSVRHGLTFNQAHSCMEISHAIQARCGLAPRPQKCAYCAGKFQSCWPF